MAIDTIGGVSAPATQSKSNIASEKLNGSFQDFLKLLTAQIQHQDPLAPMDSTTFVTQLAQLSQVEQSVQTNQNLEQIRGSLTNSAVVSDISLIGKRVEAESSQVKKEGSSTTFEYRLSDMAEEATAYILDAKGKPIRAMNLSEKTPGTAHAVTWDGRDDYGNVVADGLYRISVGGKDAEGAGVSASTYVRSTVDSVTFADGTPRLVLSNGQNISSSQIRTVS
jgi:flagellar basal-body rod modification protein FlgD